MQSEVLNNKRVFQIAAWMWLFYLVSLVIVDVFIYHPNQFFTPILYYHLLNIIPALIFLGLAYSKLLENRAKVVVPVMILLITATPILVTYLFNLHLPPAPLSNLEGMVIRQLPILLIGLVLVAWNYSLISMILYILATNLFEYVIVYGFGLMDKTSLSSFYFIIIIRTVCFILVGIFINQLISYLRSQHDELVVANNQLTHYASTIENLTVSRERNRMSRELHDTVVHTLSGLAVQLETAKAYWDIEPDTARKLLDQSLEETRAGLQETRRAIKALRASPLEDLGLIHALQTLIDSALQRAMLTVDVSLPEANTFISPDVEQCIYRVAQEAVENIIHHAAAHHMTLRLSPDDNNLELFIQDDGIGFNPETIATTGHFGLIGMKERAQLVGGQLTIDSHPKGGTTIRLFIKGGLG
jgi:signal transduction histidine kinase